MYAIQEFGFSKIWDLIIQGISFSAIYSQICLCNKKKIKIKSQISDVQDLKYEWISHRLLFIQTVFTFANMFP